MLSSGGLLSATSFLSSPRALLGFAELLAAVPKRPDISAGCCGVVVLRCYVVSLCLVVPWSSRKIDLGRASHFPGSCSFGYLKLIVLMSARTKALGSLAPHWCQDAALHIFWKILLCIFSFLSTTSRSKNRIRSTQTEMPAQVSRSAMATHALGESPRTAFNFIGGLRKRVAIEALCGFSSANSSILSPPCPRLHCTLVEPGTVIWS